MELKRREDVAEENLSQLRAIYQETGIYLPVRATSSTPQGKSQLNSPSVSDEARKKPGTSEKGTNLSIQTLELKIWKKSGDGRVGKRGCGHVELEMGEPELREKMLIPPKRPGQSH